jgi:hypothetical protein
VATMADILRIKPEVWNFTLNVMAIEMKIQVCEVDNWSFRGFLFRNFIMTHD